MVFKLLQQTLNIEHKIKLMTKLNIQFYPNYKKKKKPNSITVLKNKTKIKLLIYLLPQKKIKQKIK